MRGLRCALWSLAILLLLPILSVGWQAFFPSSTPADSSLFGVLNTLWAAKLPEYLLTSFWLGIGVSVGVSILGVGSAWVVTRYIFPGSRIFQWALLFPLAFPPYLAAYLYTDLVQIGGPLQNGLIQLFPLMAPLPSIRNLGGAIFIMCFFYYPYVFLLTRNQLESQNRSLWEAAGMLDSSELRLFFSIALSQVRHSWVAGLAMTLMETFGDFGTMEYFSVDTLTTGIYRVWYGQNSKQTAAQLAIGLLVLILLLLQLEKGSRKNSIQLDSEGGTQGVPQRCLCAGKKWIAFACCFSIAAVGFLIPTSYLCFHVWQYFTSRDVLDFGSEFLNSMLLAGLSATVCVCVSSVIYAAKSFFGQHSDVRFWCQMSSIGYAIPGTVLAVGVVWVLGSVDKVWTSVTLSGSFFALVYAHSCRFTAIPLQALAGARTAQQIHKEEASFLLGATHLRTWQKIMFPMSWPTLIVGFSLVFMDSLKELSATVFLRPFHFETMSVKIYLLASDERLTEAAPYAFILVFAGVISVTLIQLYLRPIRKRIRIL